MTADEEPVAGLAPAAFEGLVDLHSADLHAYLSRRTSGGVADDLLADVWLAAFGSRDTFDPELGSARGWLFGIARHILQNYYRRHKLRAVLGRAFRADRPTDEGAAVDARLDAAALVPALREALRSLPAVERELLLLVAWEHLTPSEAGQVLGIPAGTARSRLHRARRRMDERLGESAQVVDETTDHKLGADS
ncbi:RNA polymerase sigma-70 factor (ECF subfamily) [Kribbella orskensis]|uniref:RNA polymerase sigma-70 factor (ECF subfamily) n=1 Tax=Kribbella orskensis TaxID=2512216 RepID=A0ABY2B5T9_9ACTN|nr:MULTISPECIES: sigma-70 family RNA polymerase sigma factor [Kribbella]TCN28343.1 RNA polymerase sigma-70 factor (ECF subfamily) [Kribbella sp. VKM Ac-2500]TCO07793.1 RNA polymerase sigma-70 factor (ECF subfamily) [Kribbella orskensis]